MEQILTRKYQQAMSQLTLATDLAFQRTAELEQANARIAQLEAQIKEKEDGEQSNGLANGNAGIADLDNEPRRSNENAIA